MPRMARVCRAHDAVLRFARARSFITGSGMFKYDDLSVGCSELRTIAEAAQKGKVLPEGQDLSWLSAN